MSQAIKWETYAEDLEQQLADAQSQLAQHAQGAKTQRGTSARKPALATPPKELVDKLKRSQQSEVPRRTRCRQVRVRRMKKKTSSRVLGLGFRV